MIIFGWPLAALRPNLSGLIATYVDEVLTEAEEFSFDPPTAWDDCGRFNLIARSIASCTGTLRSTC